MGIAEPRPGVARTPLRQHLYRHRGWLAVPPALVAVLAADPERTRVLAGAALLGAGEALRLWAAAHLGMTVRSRAPRAGKLVTGGPFAHTRHPLYAGNLLLVAGLATLSGAFWPWFPLGMALAVTILYRGHAAREDAVLAAAFPEAHAAYRARVPRFGWRLRAARVTGVHADPPGFRRAIRVEALTINAIFWVVMGIWVRTRWPGGG
jgi:protein-S-isoprenylcysteine O-methyltransferase Ste14